MKKIWTILNVIMIVAVVSINGFIGANGFNGNTVGGMSDRYDNLFTPASYAFSIWSIIFIGLLIAAGYMIKKVFVDKKDDDFVLLLGPSLLLANVLNCIWLFVWLEEYTALSLLVMLGILIGLLTTVVRLHLSSEKTTNGFYWCIAVPISLYSGWITVATVANVSAYLAKIEFSAILSENAWAILMIIIAALLNVYMVFIRKMYGFGFVGIWAITAIFVRHNGEYQSIVVTCAISIVLIVLSMIGARRKQTAVH